MRLSIFDKIFEKLNIFFQYRGGNKKTSNFTAGRDINNTYNIVNANNFGDQDKIAEKGQKLLNSPKNLTNKNLVVVGNFLGIVKSIEKPGTRIHLDFAIKNLEGTPTILQGSYVKVNEGIAHFKKFYKSNANGSREPDMSKWFPIIVNSNGAEKLEIEFENVDQELIRSGLNNCEVVVLTEDNKLSSRKFALTVDQAMIKTLEESQESADKTGTPSIFPATIQSLD